MIWKKGRRVISAGKTITSIERRFRLVGNHDLEISRVKVKDTGTFTCSVDTEPLMELTHTVDVLCKYPRKDRRVCKVLGFKRQFSDNGISSRVKTSYAVGLECLEVDNCDVQQA